MVNRCKTTVRTPTWLSRRQGVKFKITGVGTGGRIVDLSLEIRENIRATVDWGIYANPTMFFCSITVSAIVPAALCSKKPLLANINVVVSYLVKIQVLIGKIKMTTNSKLKIKGSSDGKMKKNVLCYVMNAVSFLTCKVISWRLLILISWCFSGKVFIIAVPLGPSPFPVAAARVMLYFAPGVKFFNR